MRSRTILVALAMVLGSVATAHSDPEVLLRITTSSGDSILTPGENIVCTMDAGPYEVLSLPLPLYVHYSNGNILGDLRPPNLAASTKAREAFDMVSLFNPVFDCAPSFPTDSILLGFIDFFDNGGWIGAGVLFTITSAASDTGTIRFDTANFPPAHWGCAGVCASCAPVGCAPVVLDAPVIVAAAGFSSGSPDLSLRIHTQFGTDTLWVGGPSRLFFSFDPKYQEPGEITFRGIIRFTNGNIIGPLLDGVGFVPTTLATGAFDVVSWSNTLGASATDPDTIYWTMFDAADSVGLSKAGDLAELRFVPLDTGTITVDTGSGLGWRSRGCAADLAVDWEPLTVHVVPCPVRMGDCNENGVINSADLIYMVNYIFKGGPDPLPMRTVGDVNCSGGLGGSDIIYLVNYLFKSGPAPCGCYVSVI